MDDMPYTLVIPAGGDSARFAARGYKGPKGLLKFEWKEKYATMLEHVVSDKRCSVIARQEWASVFFRVLPENFNVVAVPGTEGQAHTVYQGVYQGVYYSPIATDFVVMNCDNAFDEPLDIFVAKCREQEAVCGAVVFESKRELKYGYVSDAPFFIRGAEKNPISPFALAGAFYFKSRDVFLTGFKRVGRTPEYISEMFAAIVGTKYAHVIPRTSLHEWGTPDDILTDSTVTRFE